MPLCISNLTFSPSRMPSMRSRAPEEMNDQILRCLSVASCVVFRSFLRSAGNPLGQAWDWPFLIRFLATQKMNIRT
jgi:hypothetical protein